jgi:hypothetical protein
LLGCGLYFFTTATAAVMWRWWKRIFSFRGKVRHDVYGAKNASNTNNLFRWISPSNAVILRGVAFRFIATAAAAAVRLFAADFLCVGENVR